MHFLQHSLAGIDRLLPVLGQPPEVHRHVSPLTGGDLVEPARGQVEHVSGTQSDLGCLVSSKPQNLHGDII